MAVSSTVSRIMNEYKGKIQFVMKDVPNENRKASVNASLAALAAEDQGRYWEMHDLLFDRWLHFDRTELIQNARDLGLDLERFQQSMNSSRNSEIIKKNLKLAEDLGVYMTPMFFINGRKYDGEMTYRELKKIIDEELSQAKK